MASIELMRGQGRFSIVERASGPLAHRGGWTRPSSGMAVTGRLDRLRFPEKLRELGILVAIRSPLLIAAQRPFGGWQPGT